MRSSLIRASAPAYDPALESFFGQSLLIKMGGSILKDDQVIDRVAQDLARVAPAAKSLVLVHGGGPAINDELTLRRIQWDFYEGQRITTPEMMDVIEMVLCGRVNRRMVKALNSHGLKGVGVSGSDAQLLLCERAEDRLGHVGVIQEVQSNWIHTLLDSSQILGQALIPVVSPIGVDSQGEALNVNADWAASRIAQSLKSDLLIFYTDQDGILDTQGQVIPEICARELQRLIENEVVRGGMLVKVRAILSALEQGVKEVHVLNARREKALLSGVRTICRANS